MYVPSSSSAEQMDRRHLRRSLIMSVIVCVLLSVCSFSPRSWAQEVERTEILWDVWGVPHIYAKSEEDLFYAFGWSQMENHGDLILRLYGQARGRAAEYWGASHLESDRRIWTMGVPARARAWYEAQRPDIRLYLDRFVRGMNEYAERHGDRIAPEVKVVLPVLSEDVLAHVQHVIHLSFVGAPAIGTTQRWQMRGSNGWAIGPTRSASGRAMLLANPHLGWGEASTWFEAQLIAPGVGAYGVTLVGMPALPIAFNDYLGWTHTVNTLDGADLYELELAEGGYRWDGSVRAFETDTHTLRVKQDDGSLREEPLVVRRSLHGPVVAAKKDRALAVRLVGLDQPHIFEQYWDMIRATNLNEFEAALSRLQMPFFNVVYADRDGHIMYLFGGRVPRRSEGDRAYWQGVVPGHSSENLWMDTHPYGDLPRVVDPTCGWVQNTNDPPWTSTFPRALDPDDFPPYMPPPEWIGFRSQRSMRMLIEDEEISFDELVQYKHSTRMELADRILDDLLPAVQKHGGDLARQAAAVLTTWDREADANSRGALLFEKWASVAGHRAFATSWQQDAPLQTPDGLADPQAAVEMLERAARQVIDEFGALGVPWGEVYRLRYAGRDLPANGGRGGLGIFQVLWFSRAEDGRFQASGGDSYVAAVEFSDPPRARVLLNYGNASQPDSPHRGDQLELFARKELRPVWRTREEVEAHLELREVLDAEYE